jgi:hypothetical protein
VVDEGFQDPQVVLWDGKNSCVVLYPLGIAYAEVSIQCKEWVFKIGEFYP